jgi:hypothetical protein
MNGENHLTCHCGQHVSLKDILQRGRFSRPTSPGFIYVKFRCSHCKRLGERFIPQEDFPSPAASPEVTGEERSRFEAMGGIGLNELIDFHFQLNADPLKGLVAVREK